ncbi:MAG: hypothetical protein IAE82_18180 [Opitutaceae bacterium]|nr:hypothetical protein [Opitutaceae bacterium]
MNLELTNRGGSPTAHSIVVSLRSDGTYQELRRIFWNTISSGPQTLLSGTYTYAVSMSQPDQASLRFSEDLMPRTLIFTTSYSGTIDTDSRFTFFAAQPESGAVNVSNRCWISAGRTAITGFVIGGNQRRWVLLRAVGPSLLEHGVPVVVAAPTLTLFPPGQASQTFGSWTAAPSQVPGFEEVFASAGAFSLVPDSADCATFVLLSPGNYTVHAGGATSDAEVLTEAYILDYAAPMGP